MPVAPSTSSPQSGSSSPIEALLRLCEAYRVLGPVFQRLRDRFPGHTLIPQALSPIAPGVAFGYQCDFAKIRAALEQESGWQEWHPILNRAYADYRAASGNEVRWVAWNYWDPTEPSEKQRKIQVLIADDAEIAELSRSTEPIVKLGGTSLSPNNLTSAGKATRTGRHCEFDFSERLLNSRDYAEGIWHEVFRPSFTAFENRLQTLTIVDFIRELFLERAKDSFSAVAPYSFLFGADQASGGIVSNMLPDVEQIWPWIETLDVADSIESTPAERLISRWLTAAELFCDHPELVPTNIASLVADFGRGIGTNRLEASYVILQHVAWFQKALRSKWQYVLPVPSGAYFGAMYLSMKEPLNSAELIAWHQLAVQLFSSLIVHHLSDLLKRADEERAADEQRVVLSHSIPKFVFKPMEYFATKLATRFEQGEAHQRIAETMLFLTQRGQAALAEYAPPAVAGKDSLDNADLQTVDLAAVCENVNKVFGHLREFLVHGYIDRVLQRAKSRQLFRDELCTSEAISLRQDIEAPLLVFGNAGLVMLHLWNLIDNAFRHANLEAAFHQRTQHLRDGLVITFEGESVGAGCYRFKASNTGNPIEVGQLQRLNVLFQNPPTTRAFKAASVELATKRDVGFPAGLEHERSGIGLSRFAEYLWMIWKDDPPPNGVGLVEKSEAGTSFSFLFRVPSQV